MKKGFKVIGVAALVTGVVMASATFFGCKDNDENFTALVSGDFKTQATESDITALGTVLSKNGDQIFGDTTKADFATNLRLLVNGTADMKMSIEQDGNSMSMQMGTGYDIDHILSFNKKDGALNMRGSGSYSASMSNTSSTNMGGQTAKSESTVNISGTSYSDNENAYINGKAQIKVSNPMNAESNVNFNQSVKVTQSFYDAFNMFYNYYGDENILGSLVDIYTIETLLEDAAVADSGVTVYVDKTTTEDHTKIKISMNKDYLFKDMEDAFEGMLGQVGIEDVAQYIETLKQAFDFSFYDVYVEYVNSTNTLVAYGEQIKASVSLPKDESGISISLTSNQNQWVGYTDKQAQELPTDLDSYNTEMPSIGM